MEKHARAYGRFLTSAQAVVVYAVAVLAIAAIDVATRTALDPFVKIKLFAWLTGALVMTLRIVRVLRRAEEAGSEWGGSEKLLFQLALVMPIAGIIPLAFL
jgi:hypothetical protein